MQLKRYILHAPPISLRDLLGSDLDVAQLGTIVRGLPGATEQGTKANETWRYMLRNCLVVGYKASAVVCGDSPTLVPIVAAAVRAAVLGDYQAPVLDTVVTVADELTEQRDLCAVAHKDATYDLARDWTAEPWADAWIAHCKVHPRPARTMEQRITESVDPYAWAMREGYIL